MWCFCPFKEYPKFQNPGQSESRARLRPGPGFIWSSDAPTPETAQWWFTIAHNNSFNKHLLNTYSLQDIISVLRNWEIVTKQISLASWGCFTGWVDIMPLGVALKNLNLKKSDTGSKPRLWWHPNLQCSLSCFCRWKWKTPILGLVGDCIFKFVNCFIVYIQKEERENIHYNHFHLILPPLPGGKWWEPCKGDLCFLYVDMQKAPPTTLGPLLCIQTDEENGIANEA